MEKKFQYEGAQINYQVLGEGKAVVLLHGFAEDSNIWSQQVAFLQQHCLLILPDLPGSGQSAMLQKEDAGIDDYAACVNAVLENENIDQCILLGHSMGGYVTLAFAEKYPGKLTAFGFVHSTAFADNEEKKTLRQKGIRLTQEHGVYSFLKNTTPGLFGEAYKKQHPEKVAELIEQGKNYTTEALVQYYTAMMNRPDRTAVLQESKLPVLFIIGSQDVAAPLQDLLQQVHLPKVSVIHVIEGVGHMSMWEEPAMLNGYLLDFIKELPE